MDDCVVIRVHLKTLKLVCIALASWVICFGVYQLNSAEKLRLSAVGRAVTPNISYSNENEKMTTAPMNQNLTTMSYLWMNKSHSEAKDLHKLYSQINETAASRLREKMSSKGFVSAETLQIYVHTPKSRKQLAVNFPSKSKYVTRPDGSPWLPNVDTCAVVGNGGILKGSNCGEEINAHDLVFRSNMARIDGFIQDVGNKTNLMSINCQETEVLTKCLRNTKCRNKLLRYIDVYLKDSILWLSKLHGYYKTDRDYKTFVYQLGKYRKGLIYGYPRKFLSTPVRLFWNITRLPSSGLFLHAVASHVCKEISLYGFYPFNSTESGRELPYHYYQNVSFVNKHNMPEEYSELIKLNQTGAIRLVAGNCT